MAIMYIQSGLCFIPIYFQFHHKTGTTQADLGICLLSPAGRAGDYKTHSVRVFVCYCVSRFYKGLYITLVVSPWPFQCFL